MSLDVSFCLNHLSPHQGYVGDRYHSISLRLRLSPFHSSYRRSYQYMAATILAFLIKEPSPTYSTSISLHTAHIERSLSLLLARAKSLCALILEHPSQKLVNIALAFTLLDKV